MFLRLKQKKKFLRKLVDPKKARLWVSKPKPYVLALKSKDTQVLFWSLFLKMQQKKLITAKTTKKGILIANSFFKCVLKNTDQKDICASIVFKDESKLKTRRNFFFVFLFKNQKHAFPGIQNSSLKKN